jgi:hypothetical protein
MNTKQLKKLLECFPSYVSAKIDTRLGIHPELVVKAQLLTDGFEKQLKILMEGIDS